MFAAVLKLTTEDVKKWNLNNVRRALSRTNRTPPAIGGISLPASNPPFPCSLRQTLSQHYAKKIAVIVIAPIIRSRSSVGICKDSRSEFMSAFTIRLDVAPMSKRIGPRVNKSFDGCSKIFKFIGLAVKDLINSIFLI